MTPVEKDRVLKAQGKLKAKIIKLTETIRTLRAKGKGARASGRVAARPASSKGRTRPRARSARGSEAVAS